MNIYKLTPINLNSIAWQSRRYKDEIIIRAESETRAREIAQNTLGEGTVRDPVTQSIPFRTWPSQDYVACIIIERNVDGEEGVLEPYHARVKWEHLQESQSA